MSGFFIKIVNMAISAGWIVLVVLLLRLLMKNGPKWVNPVLWGIVGLRLLMPFSVESIFSLIPSRETISPDIMYDPNPAINSGIPALNSVVNPVLEESFTPAVEASANPLQVWIPVFAGIWIAGVAVMLLYTVISYLRIQRRINTAVCLKENIYQSESVDSPFVLGVFHPRIYLPEGMQEKELKYVIAHEQAHIKRRDHWIKPLAFLLLSVYWFHPLLWAAYIFLCRDIELACDESVVKEYSDMEKADYSQTLLLLSISRKMVGACPVAFGEVGVKERVKTVLNYKKPAFWLIALAVFLSSLMAVCFLTNPLGPSLERICEEDGYSIVLQGETTVTLSIPKDALPESIYTEEGHDFKKNEIVAFETNSTSIYLKRVQISNEGKDKLYFMFDCSYNLEESGSVLLPYKKVGDEYGGGYVNNFLVQVRYLEDDKGTFHNAVTLRGQGPGEQFALYVSTDACKEAEGTLKMHVTMNELTYAEGTEADYFQLQAEKPKLTLDDLVRLAEKGEELTGREFDEYAYTVTGSGLYIRVYEIDDMFELWIGSSGMYGEPMYMTLRANDDSEDVVDIRTSDVESFIKNHKDNTVVEKYSYGYFVAPVGYSEEAYDKIAEMSVDQDLYRDSEYFRHFPLVHITRPEKLEEFETALEGLFNFERGNSYYDQKRDYTFDEAFFQESSLFFVYIGETNISNSYNVEYVKKKRYTLTIGISEYKIDEKKNDGYLMAVIVPNDSIDGLMAMEAKISSVRSPEDNDGNPIASYQFKGGDDLSYPTITLFDNGKFTLSYSVLSSYFGYGHYEWKDDGLTLWTEDGQYVHSFYKRGEDLIFDLNHSSEMPKLSGVVNGSLFEKEE